MENIMKNKSLLLSCLVICGGCIANPVEAAYAIKNGGLVDIAQIATMSDEEHFNAGLAAINSRDWSTAKRQFFIVSSNFPNTTCGQEANYYLGVANYYHGELDFANEAFSKYLKVHNNPQFFEEAIEYKFAIARQFQNGAKKRFFGIKHLPKWAPAESMAVEIYDEVVAALPCHELAAKALFAKGCLLMKFKDYEGSIETFQTLIKRFPKHELSCESYLLIANVYVEEGRVEFQNPDILALAQINLRKFKHDFPRDERIAQAECDVQTLKEIYARGLYDTGLFYERICQPRASMIYYQNAINQFPDTTVAQLCEQRLALLNRGAIKQQNSDVSMEADAKVSSSSKSQG